MPAAATKSRHQQHRYLLDSAVHRNHPTHNFFRRQRRSALYYINNGDNSNAVTKNRVGEVLLDGKYMLTGYIPVPSPKCEIYKAYPLNAKGQIQGNQPLIVKFSNSNMDLEYVNYQRLWSRLAPEQHHLFVQIHDRVPGTEQPVNEWGRATTTPAAQLNQRQKNKTSHHPPGIVMERGYDNLRVFIMKNGAYKGEDLRGSFQSVIQAVHALHSNQMIWTELKPENFVVTPKGIKGIDLESIVQTHDWLQVYTAEACPPEFPLDEMYKTLPELRVTEAFDVWALGLVLFEMATGKPFYAEGLTDLEFIKRQLRNVHQSLQQAQFKLQNSNVDPHAAALIMACLRPNPSDRPSCQQLLNSKYFKDTTPVKDPATLQQQQQQQNLPEEATSYPPAAITLGAKKATTTQTEPSPASSKRSSVVQPNAIRIPATNDAPTAKPMAQRYSAIAAAAASKATTTTSKASNQNNAAASGVVVPTAHQRRPAPVRVAVLNSQKKEQLQQQAKQDEEASAARHAAIPAKASPSRTVSVAVARTPAAAHHFQGQKQKTILSAKVTAATTTTPAVSRPAEAAMKRTTPTMLAITTLKSTAKSKEDVVVGKVALTTKPKVHSGASSTSSESKKEAEKQQRIDWKNQLTQVLDSLALHAQEDPELAYDLVSILDQAKEKVLPTPTPTLGY